MKEFMLFIRATGNPIGKLSKDLQEKHIEKVGGFIHDIIATGNMKSAQPLLPNGVMISNNGSNFSESPLDEKEEMIVGYYHIQAENMNDAITIAKADPRFEDGNWRMEVREIMKIDGIN